jgi:zinc transporter, ZIP family
MGEAMWWAFVGASSLLIGVLLAFWMPIGRRLLGMIMAFGAGVLISAVSYELVEEAVAVAADSYAVATGFVAGALVFFTGDVLIDRHVASASARGGGGFGIVLGAVLDGIPESVVIGASALTGESASVAVIVAVFLSNVPESIAASTDLVRDGMPKGRVLLMWIVVVATSTIAAGVGYALLKDASGVWVSAIQAFAAGAILTMLADEMIPEAFEKTDHRKSVGLAVAFGFALSAALSFSS